MDTNIVIRRPVQDWESIRYTFNASTEYADIGDFWEDQRGSPEYFPCSIIKIGESVWLNKKTEMEWDRTYHEGDQYSACYYFIEENMAGLPDGYYQSDWLLRFDGENWEVEMSEVQLMDESPLDELYGVLHCGYTDPLFIESLTF